MNPPKINRNNGINTDQRNFFKKTKLHFKGLWNTSLQRRAYDAKDSDSHQNTEVRSALRAVSALEVDSSVLAALLLALFRCHRPAHKIRGVEHPLAETSVGTTTGTKPNFFLLPVKINIVGETLRPSQIFTLVVDRQMEAAFLRSVPSGSGFAFR